MTEYEYEAESARLLEISRELLNRLARDRARDAAQIAGTRRLIDASREMLARLSGLDADQSPK